MMNEDFISLYEWATDEHLEYCDNPSRELYLKRGAKRQLIWISSGLRGDKFSPTCTIAFHIPASYCKLFEPRLDKWCRDNELQWYKGGDRYFSRRGRSIFCQWYIIVCVDECYCD